MLPDDPVRPGALPARSVPQDDDAVRLRRGAPVPPGELAPWPRGAIGARRGLSLPLVYNTGGYDSPEALALLGGVVDVYMPDAKYADDEAARRCSHVRDYVTVNRAALREMHRQVGELVVDPDGSV